MPHSPAAPLPGATEGLSRRACLVWAKSAAEGETHSLIGWLPLYQHLDDAAAIAHLLWDCWVPDAVKRVIGAPLGGDLARARRLLVWLVALHDLGKCSPAFSVQVPELAALVEEQGLHVDPSIQGTEDRRRARHEIVGHRALKDWLVRDHGFDGRRASQYASIVAAHHGMPPDAMGLQQVRNPRLYGAGGWAEVRQEFLDRAQKVHLEAGDLQIFVLTELTETAEMLLSSLVIVADWIASAENAFPYAALGEFPDETTEQRAARAWAVLDLPAAWHPPIPDATIEALFATRFSLPAGSEPWPGQRALVGLARETPEPSLFILEAEMGTGKTEAALAAAEILSARFAAGGIFIALPTQATADGMFDRVLRWTGRLGLDTPENVFLAHGKSRLNSQYEAMARSAYFRSIGDQEGARDRGGDGHARTRSDDVIAHHWFSDPKRGPLSTFVVGTIDQSLFSALRARHVMLRHLALAGKVVIIDEAHAYSTFMNQYMERMLHWLGAYGACVIMLSATLPGARRAAFVAAYDSGRSTLSEAPDAEVPARYAELSGDIGYPSVTMSRTGSRPLVAAPQQPTNRVRRVSITRLDDAGVSLVQALREVLRGGGCAAVIRNTVKEVQETAHLLAEEFGDDAVTIAHSRFIALERAANDAQLLHWFGPPGPAVERPSKRIVVASQVIEQSLDIDFDVMVTDIAPVDLLLQRAGRLHRHRRGDQESERPERLREPRLFLTGVDFSATPPEPSRGAQAVYSSSILYRTLGVLDGCNEIELPEDIPSLVQTVYSDERVGPDAWQEAMSDARRVLEKRNSDKIAQAKLFRLGEVDGDEPTLIGLLYANADDPTQEARGRATVRDGDETIEVLVLQRDGGGVLRTVSTLPEGGGRPLPLDAAPDWTLTRTILGSSLRLPAMLAKREGGIEGLIRSLELGFAAEDELQNWHASRELRGELALVLDENGDGRLPGFILHYDRTYGLEVARE